MSTPASSHPTVPTSRTLRVPLWTLPFLVLAGTLLGAAVTWQVNRDRGEPAILQGMVTGVNSDGTAIGFTADSGTREGEGLALIADVPWTDAAGEMHGGTDPTCLLPGSSGQRLELGVLDIGGTGNWPSRAVVWVHCLN
ncbi:hypothetical protein [Micromonospora sp. NPDC005367]|uniref:hypothetical protein n=1 Tax=Micromonospora sp. NPDC005367 TaxID=3155590 RepID=UPI0033A19A1C